MRIEIVTNKVLPYRNHFYQLLAQDCELIVHHFGDFSESDNYKIKYYPQYKLKRFYGLKSFSLSKLKKADVIICTFDISFITLYKLLFSDYSNKLILWGIGVSTAHGLKKKRYLDRLRIVMANKVAGIILYSSQVADYYRELGFQGELAVATNSVLVSETATAVKTQGQENYLFIGSLMPRKGVDIFLKAYALFLRDQSDAQNKVVIVGKGPEEERLKLLSQELGITNHVMFKGAIHDADQLTRLYKESILSFSIHQAGLSVLQSLGNGVPFITRKNAITGGELFNIIEGKTGFLLKEIDEELLIMELKELLLKINKNKNDIINMRDICVNHYKNQASLDLMVRAFLNISQVVKESTKNKEI